MNAGGSIHPEEDGHDSPRPKPNPTPAPKPTPKPTPKPGPASGGGSGGTTTNSLSIEILPVLLLARPPTY